MKPDINDTLRNGGEEAVRERLAQAEPFKPSSRKKSASGQQAKQTRDYRLIDPALWEGAPVPERQWIVPDFIPASTVTMLAGEGGVGKSVLALQLGAARAARKPWLGTMTLPGRTLYLSCEDDEDDLHRRLDAIRAHFEVRFADLTDLHCVDLVGEDAVLGAIDRKDAITATSFYRDVCGMIEDFAPELVIVDALADVFAGKENERTHARQFVSLLKGPARKYGCAILLLAHPSLTGLNTGTGSSGSTAWGNSVRSRIVFERPKANNGSPPDSCIRSLTTNKSNYTLAGASLTVTWQAGAYVAQAGPGFLDRLAAERRADEAFLSLLSLFNGQGQSVSVNPGSTFAPVRFAEHPNATGVSKTEFAAAMQRLLAAGKIKIEETGSPSRRRSRLVLTEG